MPWQIKKGGQGGILCILTKLSSAVKEGSKNPLPSVHSGFALAIFHVHHKTAKPIWSYFAATYIHIEFETIFHLVWGPFAEELAPTGEGRFFADLELFHRLPHFETFSRESPCAEIAAQLMDSSKINFLYDQLFVKWPGTTKETLYHQDLSYWAVSGEKICSVWIPLDPMSSEQGLRFVKGGHLWPLCAPMAFQDGTQ